MDAPVETEVELVSAVADIRHVPLGTLAREAEARVSESLERVLPQSARHGVAVAAFNSSI